MKIYFTLMQTEEQTLMRTIIHELIHAYLYESGLTIKTFDEDTVEYLTTMFINLEKITGDINEISTGD